MLPFYFQDHQPSILSKNKLKVNAILLLLLLTLIGCRTTLPPSTPSPTPLPPFSPTPSLTPSPLPSLPPSPLPSLTPSPFPSLTPPPPLRLGAVSGVPPEFIARAQALAGASSQQWEWAGSETAVDVQLALGAGRPLATWIYVVAAPFAALNDEIGWTELQQAWATGALHLDPGTYATLQAVWGQPAQPATLVDESDLLNHLWATQASYERPALTIRPFDRLTPQLKVLRLDGAAPIDADFNPDNYSLTLTIGLQGDPDAIDRLWEAWDGPATNYNTERITRVAMTGPAGMRRAVADRMERYGINYPGEETGPVLQAADIAHMSNENAFASDCPMPDPFDSANVCNRDEYIALMTWMGINVNEMTGNHLNDWGVAALLHTFDLYDAHGIQTFGGGRNLEHARQPLLIEHNGNRLAFVGCNPVGPAFGWAREDYPGALPCNDYTELRSQIGRLATEGYLVFATLQYLEDYQYRTLPQQRADFDALAAAGATAVSGSHAHHPQGFAFPHGRFVHYGLGNLLADQMWSLGSRQMTIDTYLIYDGHLLNVDLWTGINEDYARVRQMTAEERRDLLQILFDVSFWEIP